MLSEVLLFYLRPIVFCSVMLFRKDPDLISSVTLLTGARGLLVGALKAICFSGKTCLVPSVSPHRSGAPDPKQSWNRLLKFASVHWCVSCICGWGLWYSGCGLMSTEQGNHPFSLLAVVLLTQPRKLLAFAASAHCWLTLSSIHTKTFHWPASQRGPACIVYSFPSAGQGFFSCWISEGSYFFCLKIGARFAFLPSSVLGGLSCSFQRCPLQVSGIGCSLPCPMDASGLSSPQIPESILIHCWASPSPTLPLSAEAWRTFVVKTGIKKAWRTSALPVCTVTKSPASVAVFSEKEVIIFKHSN